MKLKTFLIQVLWLALTICAQAQNADGTFTVATMNMDGLVNISDVVSLVNYILGQSSYPFNLQAADTSADNAINISDVVSLVNIILQ